MAGAGAWLLASANHTPRPPHRCRCGSSFEVAVVSGKFTGLRLLARHKLVNAALQEVMPAIHALSIKRVWTPEQAAAADAPTAS